tara:strand:- start:629 stop:1339 length:711 start_codon:yes stop_codon:yes gene_type:complete
MSARALSVSEENAKSLRDFRNFLMQENIAATAVMEEKSVEEAMRQSVTEPVDPLDTIKPFGSAIVLSEEMSAAYKDSDADIGEFVESGGVKDGYQASKVAWEVRFHQRKLWQYYGNSRDSGFQRANTECTNPAPQPPTKDLNAFPEAAPAGDVPPEQVLLDQDPCIVIDSDDEPFFWIKTHPPSAIHDLSDGDLNSISQEYEEEDETQNKIHDAFNEWVLSEDGPTLASLEEGIEL